jgi:hypothetical protein
LITKEKVGRNDPCPCGSGKKFKRCHLGREEELSHAGMEDLSVEEMGAKIVGLARVRYGRSEEMMAALDLEALTGSPVGVAFVDLREYTDLNLFGGVHVKALRGQSGGVFINPFKTAKVDSDNLYLAISRDIDDSTLVHEMAHVLDYLGGSRLVPGTLAPLSLELTIPVEHLEHPKTFGHWLDVLAQKFEVQLDADDTLIRFLYQEGLLIEGEAIQAKNTFTLKAKSEHILRFLSERSGEIDALIRELPGYIGPRRPQD